MKKNALPMGAAAAVAAGAPAAAALAAPQATVRGAQGLQGAVLLALLLGLSHYLLSTPGVDIPAERTLSALAWPAPAIAMALLWQRRLREWPLYLLAMGVALVLVGRLDWLPLRVDLMFAAIGLGQAGLGAWIGRRWVARDGQIATPGQLLRFMLCLPLGMSALHAVVTSTVLWSVMGTSWLEQACRIYAASALAVVALVPALLARERPPGQAWPAAAPAWRDLAAPALFLALLSASAALALVPDMSDELLRALLTLPLCWAALCAGMARVAHFNAAIAMALVSVTLAGLGPYAPRGEQGILALQVDLIGLSALSLCLAAAIGGQRRLAARLEHGRRMQALGFLAGGIAHDFNNLLGTMAACAEMAAERLPPGAPAQAELALLEREAARGRDMTQQLLLAARQGDPARGAVPLDEVVAEVLASAQALCPAHVRLVREALPGQEHIRVLAHRGQIVRALHNLLRNAALAARSQVSVSVGTLEAGPVKLRLHAQAGGCEQGQARRMGWIEVRDDGAGIAPQHWDHLFEPFYSTRLADGGSGLGLAIVAGVATGHGGWVGMRTDAGRGSCFRIAVPLFTGGTPT